DARGPGPRHAGEGDLGGGRRERPHAGHATAAVRAGLRGDDTMKPNSVAVVGAAETTDMGRIPNLSVLGLHADAALNAMADAGLKPSDIDGVATAGESVTTLANYLGIVPTYVDGTSVGGCSFMLHVRHAAAAINAGLCKTVLITHAESGKSMVGKLPR